MEKLYENDKFVLRKSDNGKWIYLHVKENGKEIQPKGYVVGFNGKYALDIGFKSAHLSADRPALGGAHA